MSRTQVFDLAVRRRLRHIARGAVCASICVAGTLPAQAPTPVKSIALTDDSLSALVAIAMRENPAIAATRFKVAAAKTRVGPAGSRSDPMLMLGVENVPVRPLSLSADDMTMKVIGIEQNLPYPGKLSLRKRTAEIEVTIAEAAADSVRLGVVRDIKKSWYSLAYLDAALGVAQRNHALLSEILKVASARYSSVSGTQQDVLRARLDAARTNENANALKEEQRAVVAELNALLDRPSNTALPRAMIPSRINRAAVDTSARNLFVSNDLGSSVSDSPLYPLDSLQVMASRSNPELRVMRAMGEAASTELELSRKDYLPDFDLSLQYGQRSGRMEGPEGAMMPRSDMVTAMVSFPIPLQKTRKQNAVVKSSQSALSAIQAETRAAQNRLAAEIARTYSDISHQRTLLALTSKTFLPQARATIASATNSYQSGTGDLNSVLVAQATLLEVELTYHRALSDFASKVADLEALVGQEVLR